MKRIQHSVSVLSVVCLMLCISIAHAHPKKKVKAKVASSNIAKLFPYKGRWTNSEPPAVLNIDNKGKCTFGDAVPLETGRSWKVQGGSLIETINYRNSIPASSSIHTIIMVPWREICKFTPHANGQKMECLMILSLQSAPGRAYQTENSYTFILDRQWAN